MRRKLNKFINSPGVFIRDLFLNRYPLYLTQGATPFLSEKCIIDVCNSLELSFYPDFDIDVVYTWVSNNDPKWKSKRDFYVSEWINKSMPLAMEPSRFEDHDEIYFSLVSVGKFMPWVRNIYIITDEQIPDIPDEMNDKIIFIDHTQIIPEEYLPTFNSHVIEACLHHIDGLSENFIYFNDDFFVCQELSPSHFFYSNNIASLFVSDKYIKNTEDPITATAIACKNSNDIFSHSFDMSFSKGIIHSYVPLQKKYYALAYENYSKEIYGFLPNKFRSDTDINMATFFIPYLQYILGAAIPRIDISYYFNIRSPSAKFFYARLLDAKASQSLPHSFCANDFSSNEFPNIDCKTNFKNFAKEFYECE